MHDLTPITALGAPQAQTHKIGEVSLCENPNVALFCVAAQRGKEADCAQKLEKLLPALPQPNELKIGDPICAFWMSSDMYMLMTAFETHETYAEELAQDFGSCASITEQTDGWVCFDLRGSRLEAVMELICPVNLRASSEGLAQRTSIEYIGCFVLQMHSNEWIRVIGPRSSALSLHHAIIGALKSAL